MKVTKQKELKSNPLKNANYLSMITFWWLNGFFRQGKERDLQETDMFELLKMDQSNTICDKLERNWNKELEAYHATGKKPSLFKAVGRTFFLRWLVFGLVACLEEVFMVINPLLIAGILRYFEGREPITNAYCYAAGMFVVPFFISLFHHIYFFNLQRMGWHIRAGTCALMYKKTLRLSQKALASATTGQIVNLGATDVMRFDMLTLFLHFIWISPVTSLVITYLLWKDLGPSSLAGIIIMFVFMGTQSLLGRQFARLRAKMAVLTDRRVRTMNEVLTAMRVIKMYTWEKPFESLIGSIRRQEIRKVAVSSIMKACNFSMIFVTSRLLIFATVAIYVSTGGHLTASKVFSAIALYNVIRVSMGIFFPLAIEKLAESLISMRRIQEFLLLDEIKPGEKPDADEKVDSDAKKLIEFRDFTASWTDREEDSQAQPTLSDINVKVDTCKLLAVIGPVGSGKSTFLNAILREIAPSGGSLMVRGSVAYVGQVPWIFSGSIRDNILFGEPFHEKRYGQVIKSCALVNDIASLPQRDHTLVGERGVTLSGGQKARVNLARAAYRLESDILLMDDPLSAVDVAVANKLFDNCICGFLKDKIRILVTHQLQFLKDADEILIFKYGEIVGRGTFDELLADGTDFASLLKKEEEDPTSPTLSAASSQFVFPLDGDVIDQGIAESTLRSDVALATPRMARKNQENLEKSELHDPEEEQVSLITKDKVDYVAHVEKEETRVMGSIGFDVYKEYLGSNKPLLVFLAVLIIANHSLYLLCDWWLSIWANRSEIFYKSLEQRLANNSTNASYFSNFTATPAFNTSISQVTTMATATTTIGDPDADFNDNYYLAIFGALTAAFIVAMYSRTITQFYYCVISGISMHDKMFHAILHAPIRFFDVNPVGRILNRFSKDMGQVDEILPLTLMDFIYISFTIFSILLLAVIINFYVLIVVLPLLCYFVWLRQYYIKTSRDIKRMEGASRSPVFSHLSSTLQGLATVRAFGMQNYFEQTFHQMQDLHSSAWFLFLGGGRWLALRLDTLSAFFIGTVAFSSVILSHHMDLDAGQVGLTLSYSIMLMGMFQWGVRQSTEVENQMTSVERIQEYYKIEPEAPHDDQGPTPPPEWPQYGVVTFDNLCYSHYRGGPDVLHKIRLNVKAHEKVGVVGRTGAGKSSLISALFRMNEYTTGEIYIDGIAASSLGLTSLRSALSVIPQDPLLFAGTLRKNLDPFSVFIDSELWDALEQVQLRHLVESFPLKLECEVAEAGSNFSVGQRQLVCLARAILRKSKILIVDEATANVDMRTDKLIQLTIRQTFRACTVITVAHRINTIIDSDRVLVMDAGRVTEFDEPHLLLTNKESAFSQMVDATGKSQARDLREVAKEAYEENHRPVTDDDVEDAKRSYMARFLPVPGSYDHLELESNV